ncbi:MAG: diguanylate cyclase [Clostridiales bacterium]
MGCYLFLFFAFLAAKKNKIINSFLVVLAIFLLWTGGSFFMRIQFWPGVKFWFDLSIVGLILLPFAFYNFVHAFVNDKGRLFWWIFLVLGIVNNILNITTGFFIKCPSVVPVSDGGVVFQYDIGWTIILLFASAGITILGMLYLLLKYSRNDAFARRQFAPIIVGIAILFLGHICTLIPFFKGFPTDVLSGIINAGFMFYALYKRRMFKLTLLVSRWVIYGVSVFLCVVLFLNILMPLGDFFRDKMGIYAEYNLIIVALLFSLVTATVSFVIKKFINILFINDEKQQAESLREFSNAISKSLQVDEIMGKLVDVIHKTIDVEKVYVCVPDSENQNYIIAHSTSPLTGKAIKLGAKNPAIKLLVTNNQCVLMREFQRSFYYKSMWEVEKQQLQDLHIECLAPLNDGENLVGIILLSNKVKGKAYSYDDLDLLDSINSISSIAVSNSRLYEKAYLEARTDELTGLLNRKYFYVQLQTEYEKSENASLSLIIFNIDDFKLYNQLYGMREGDKALKSIAKIIDASVGSHGYVARYSGKEFAVILPNYDVLAAKKLAISIGKQIANMNRREADYALKVLTVSGGICTIPYAANNIKELVENADMAVYNVKRRGKNAILVYEIGEVSNKNESNVVNKEDVYSEYAATVSALTAAIDTKDHYTFSHSKNVAYYVVELAKACGMNSDFVEIVREAGLLHDIGKIGISEQILNKPGKLTDDEYMAMKSHVEHSIGIIRNLPSLDYVIPAVIGHHERYDGKGYPRGIKGENIPLSARMLCVADSFDAMVSKRIYKPSFDVEYALLEVEKQAGLQFDPDLAAKFVDLVKNKNIEVQ